jgi:hypothetical protein
MGWMLYLRAGCFILMTLCGVRGLSQEHWEVGVEGGGSIVSNRFVASRFSGAGGGQRVELERSGWNAGARLTRIRESRIGGEIGYSYQAASLKSFFQPGVSAAAPSPFSLTNSSAFHKIYGNVLYLFQKPTAKIRLYVLGGPNWSWVPYELFQRGRTGRLGVQFGGGTRWQIGETGVIRLEARQWIHPKGLDQLTDGRSHFVTDITIGFSKRF